MALDEAKREGKVNVAWDGKATNFDRLPAAGELKLEPDAPYALHLLERNDPRRAIRRRARRRQRPARLRLLRPTSSTARCRSQSTA